MKDSSFVVSRKTKIILIAVLLVIYVIDIAVFIFMFKPVSISGNSMYPTLPNNSIVFVRRVFKQDDIKRGDIVTTRYKFIDDYPSVVKRVAFLPGEVVTQDARYENTRFVGFELREDEYFLVGDNYAESQDSRIFGPVKFSGIWGVVSTKPLPSWLGTLITVLIFGVPVVLLYFTIGLTTREGLEEQKLKEQQQEENSNLSNS